MTFDKIDTRFIADDDRPWVPFLPYSDLVWVKLYRVDPVRGEVISVLRAPPGVELPRCRQTGTATIYTVQGRWKYLEHDWVAGPGSVVIETATSRLTPHALADGTDDIILFMVTSGETLLLDDEGRVVGTESWRTAVERYVGYCLDNDLEPKDLTDLAA
jgi:2,4'-dihydroxyacetophenone dioxygenase